VFCFTYGSPRPLVELFSSWIVVDDMSPPYPNTFNVGISMHIVLMGFSQGQKGIACNILSMNISK
jgi:hypothetical protein